MKGGSSRYISEALRPGAWFKWQGNYGAFSVSPQDKAKVLNYILNQKQHHSEGTLWPGAETSVIEKNPANALPAQAGNRRDATDR